MHKHGTPWTTSCDYDYTFLFTSLVIRFISAHEWGGAPIGALGNRVTLHLFQGNIGTKTKFIVEHGNKNNMWSREHKQTVFFLLVFSVSSYRGGGGGGGVRGTSQIISG